MGSELDPCLARSERRFNFSDLRHYMSMAFRDHPLMTRRSGMKSWPPIWSSTRKDKTDWPKGEVGTLREAWLHEGLDTCLFLFIEYHGHRYTDRKSTRLNS